MDLHARIPIVPERHAFIARISQGEERDLREIPILRGEEPSPSSGPALRLGGTLQTAREIPVPETLSYLAPGDIVRVNQHGGELRVLYRRNSLHNVLFMTERCNSRCLMCSQPPRDIDDTYLVDEILETLPLMDPATKEICITGGEPTLLGSRLLDVIAATKQWLPDTALHMLSNGRRFALPRFAEAVAEIGHPEFMTGIPVYADVADRHDFVVQSKGAFDETIRGIMNLARFGQKIEIRFVMHRQTVDRLPQTMRFIAQNLPFVNQVALMGLEMMGFTKANLSGLWIDPWDYRDLLSEAVDELDAARIPTLIYNHQLCLLPERLWPKAVRSISDWKNIYMPECKECAARARCGGFFASAPLRYSQHIQPISDTPSDEAICSLQQ